MKTIVYLSQFLLTVGCAYAQSLQLNWSSFDGGGGPSAGDSFSLNGTIGQPDAGASMSGGLFTITGGFWAGVTGVAVGPMPPLAIRLGAPNNAINTVILTWANPSTGYGLQQTSNMSAAGGGWTDVQQTPIIVGQNKEVTLLATGQFCMFRLRASEARKETR